MKMKFTYAALFILLISLGFNNYGFAQLEIEWEISLGSSTSDYPAGICETIDGGCLVIGDAYTADGDISNNNGFNDCWVAKLNSMGELVWENNYGGTANDVFRDVKPLEDGGFVLAGSTFSDDGDIALNRGKWDVWFIKIDSLGLIEWNNTYGGSETDQCNTFRRTNDGGYILAGESFSNDFDVSDNKGLSDFWVLKLNSAGEIEWEKNYGGSDYEEATAIETTTDGGYLIGGFSRSSDGDITSNEGLMDFCMLKIDSLGNLEWQKSYGGSDYDYGRAVVQTSDGGYLVSGTTNSSDGDVSNNFGESDVWLLKLNSLGELEWEKNYGGSEKDNSWNNIALDEGGFLITGMTMSNDGDVSNNSGITDHWLIKIDDNGGIEWERTFGGTDQERAVETIQTDDGSLLVTGFSHSSDGDVSSNNGNADYWIYKLSDPISIITVDNNEIRYNIFPNPTDGTFQITSLNSPVPVTVEIYSLSGQLVFQKENVLDDVEVDWLDRGSYIVKLSNEKGADSELVIIH